MGQHEIREIGDTSGYFGPENVRVVSYLHFCEWITEEAAKAGYCVSGIPYIPEDPTRILFRPLECPYPIFAVASFSITLKANRDISRWLLMDSVRLTIASLERITTAEVLAGLRHYDDVASYAKALEDKLRGLWIDAGVNSARSA